MLAYYRDWEQGHTPVTTGRAPWLPSPFVQAMHVCRSEIANAEAEYAKAQQRKVTSRVRN